MDPYKNCPVFKSRHYTLRLVDKSDAADLLRVYSDKLSMPLFNSDNCVDDFCYSTIEQMNNTIGYWLEEYKLRYYVRWAIVDNLCDTAIGTIELFRRSSEDFFDDCGLLRLDLRSDHERIDRITEILSLIVTPAYDMFGCSMIATKIPPAAAERKEAAEALGFRYTEHKLTAGADQKEYSDYYVLFK